MTVANNLYKFMFHNFDCVSWIHPWNFPYEHTTEFVSVAEPARLPGSYGEALGLRCLYRVILQLSFTGTLINFFVITT